MDKIDEIIDYLKDCGFHHELVEAIKINVHRDAIAKIIDASPSFYERAKQQLNTQGDEI